MQENTGKFNTVDEYIAAFPEDIQERLRVMRATIKAAAPEAEEKIGYNQPAYHQHGYLVYFAAAKKHIGFYPATSSLEQFGDEAVRYRTSTGTLQFPHAAPLPLDLISRIVQFRVAENLQKAEAKAAKKKKA